MGLLYLPDVSEIMAVAQSRGALSDAPHLWDGLVGAWPMQEGGGLTARDVSGYGSHGTLTDMDPATAHVVTEKGRALDFDGVNDYINSFLSLASDTYSISLWARADVNLSAWRYLADLRADSGTGYIAWTENTIVAQSGTVYIDAIADATYGSTDRNWHHVAVSGITLAASNLKIATNLSGTGEFWPGPVTNLSIFNRVLLPSEIQQLYSDPWAMYTLRRRVFPAAVGIPYWVFPRSSQIIGGGVA